MYYFRLLFIGLFAVFLTSCGSLPERVESSDIPDWCQEEEEDTALLPYLLPGISTILQIADALADEKFYACGIATGSEIGATRREALKNAKEQIYHQLVGKVLSKVKRSELIKGYESQVHSNAFSYKVVEFESVDIKSGYTIFLLVKTQGKDLIGTIEALRNKQMLQKDKAYKKKNDNAGYFRNKAKDVLEDETDF